ncbi:MAG: helix-turn-helix transcriptional regulator [Chlamydiales bacterium]
MKPLIEMTRRNQSSPYFGSMVRFAQPLFDHFGINHFWYYRILSDGTYAYVGTHEAWNEYCAHYGLIKYFPCVRHPDVLQPGITFMKTGLNAEAQEILNTIWEKFGIHFNLNIFERCSEGISAFGFGTRFNNLEAEERLLNELPLLRYFTKEFRKRHQKLIRSVEDNGVDLNPLMGRALYEPPKGGVTPCDRSGFLRELGCTAIFALSPREKEVLAFLANGFPASYIKEKLHLGSVRTVESYISSIKNKLSCHSKVELIEKAKEIASTGFLEYTDA